MVSPLDSLGLRPNQAKGKGGAKGGANTKKSTPSPKQSGTMGGNARDGKGGRKVSGRGNEDAEAKQKAEADAKQRAANGCPPDMSKGKFDSKKAAGLRIPTSIDDFISMVTQLAGAPCYPKNDPLAVPAHHLGGWMAGWIINDVRQ